MPVIARSPSGRRGNPQSRNEEIASRSLACEVPRSALRPRSEAERGLGGEVPDRREWGAKPNGLSMTASRIMLFLHRCAAHSKLHLKGKRQYLEEIPLKDLPRDEGVAPAFLTNRRGWTMAGEQAGLVWKDKDLLADALQQRIPIPTL